MNLYSFRLILSTILQIITYENCVPHNEGHSIIIIHTIYLPCSSPQREQVYLAG